MLPHIARMRDCGRLTAMQENAYSYKDAEDALLVKAYLEGDDRAFEVLTGRYSESIYRFIYRLIGSREAEDLTQEVFLKAWKNLKKFDQSKNWKTWLYAIARNTSIDWLRKKKSFTFSSFERDEEADFAGSIADSEPLADELFEKRELQHEVGEALKTLPLDAQTIIVLHEAEGLTFESIGEILDEPLNTVKSRYRRALIRLRDILTAPKDR